MFTVFRKGKQVPINQIGPVWCHWNGGTGFAGSYPDDPYQRFETLEDAYNEHDGAYRGHGFTGQGEEYSGDTPCVELDCTTWVFLADPNEEEGYGDPYPDYVIEQSQDENGILDDEAEWGVISA